MTRIEHGDLPGKPDRCGRHKGLGLGDANFIDRLARAEIIGAVNDNIDALQQLSEPVAIDAFDHGFDHAIGIQFGNGRKRRHRFALPDTRGGMDDLALQIG